MVRAVISSNEENMKKAQNTAIKRLIYALGIFLVFSVVQVVMGIIAEAGVKDLAGENIDTVTWKACWTCKSKKDCKVVEPGGEGVCCVLPNDKGERYIWHESANSCPSGEWKTDMKKSICMGNSSPIKGVCCSKTENDSITYSWNSGSNVCPSGSEKVNRKKSSCSGTLS